MKDLPHHMKKLNRRIIRSERWIEQEESATSDRLANTPRKQTQRELKKQAKAKIRKTRENRTPEVLSPEERNREMKYRTPIFDRTSHPRLKTAKKTRKKTPPL